MRLLFALPILLAPADVAVAQPAPLPPALLACASIARDAERLACYDRAVEAVSADARAAAGARAAEAAKLAAAEAAAAKARAEAEAAALAAKKAADKEARMAAFGGAAIGKGLKDPEAVEEVPSKLAELLTNASGLGVFLLENGQLWKQVDTTPLGRVKAGDDVVLSHGALGGYRLTFSKSGRWVTVKRLR
jgi:hypothetical protein